MQHDYDALLQRYAERRAARDTTSPIARELRRLRRAYFANHITIAEYRTNAAALNVPRLREQP